MNPRFEEKERALRFQILDMGILAEEMIHLSMAELLSDDSAAGGILEEKRRQVKRLHREIEGTLLGLLALFQPAASDLRAIFAAIRIGADLDRIAGLAKNIHQASRHFIQFKPTQTPFYDIPRMAAMAKEMVKEALNAYISNNAEEALSIFKKEKLENELKSQAFNELLQIMKADSTSITHSFGLVLISRNLEKIADHATNIAENVVFIVKGTDIRHPGLRQAKIPA